MCPIERPLRTTAVSDNTRRGPLVCWAASMGSHNSYQAALVVTVNRCARSEASGATTGSWIVTLLISSGVVNAVGRRHLARRRRRLEDATEPLKKEPVSSVP
jgi:hypothetical protein